MIVQRTGSNLLQVKSSNLSAVLSTIRRIGLVSRTELTEYTHLTPSTITNLVNELLRWNLLVEAGCSASQGGRRRTLLRLNADAYWAMAINCQPESVEGALVNLTGSIGWRCAVNVTPNTPAKDWIHTVTEVHSQLVEKSQKLGWITVGMGMTQCQLPLTEPANSQPPLDRLLQVRVDYGVRAATLAEAWYGCGKEANSLVYLNWQSAPELGVLINGAVLRGAHGKAAMRWPEHVNGYACNNKILAIHTLLDAVNLAACAYDPDVIVLSSRFVQHLPRNWQSSVANHLGGTHTVFPAALGHDATLIGAACLLWEDFFVNPIGFLVQIPVTPKWGDSVYSASV